MVKRAKTPNYIKIAVDIAYRIVRSEFSVGSKITGRTTLVSIYKVSPETIRRSIALLKDMNVVEVCDKSGIIIKDKECAKDFLNKFKTETDFSSIVNECYELLNEKKSIDEKIENNLKSIIEFSTQLRNVSSIVHFESIIEKDSIVVGKSISELNFWHNTKATIVGVRRNNETFLSPGPYFTLLEKDVILYVGNDDIYKNVINYISQIKD